MITAEQLIARAVEIEDTARRAELAGCTVQARIDRAVAAELRRLATPPPTSPGVALDLCWCGHVRGQCHACRGGGWGRWGHGWRPG
jgi:hypothetical protein